MDNELDDIESLTRVISQKKQTATTPQLLDLEDEDDEDFDENAQMYIDDDNDDDDDNEQDDDDYVNNNQRPLPITTTNRILNVPDINSEKQKPTTTRTTRTTTTRTTPTTTTSPSKISTSSEPINRDFQKQCQGITPDHKSRFIDKLFNNKNNEDPTEDSCWNVEELVPLSGEEGQEEDDEEEEDEEDQEFESTQSALKKHKSTHNNSLTQNINDEEDLMDIDYQNRLKVIKNTSEHSIMSSILNNNNNNNNTNNFYNINASEALSLNLQYQELLKSFLTQIAIAKKRNNELVKKIKLQQSQNITQYNNLNKRHIHEKKAGFPFFAYDIQVDGVTQTFYPADNLDTEFIRKAYENMPMYFKSKKWTKNDINLLHKGVQERAKQKRIFRISESNLTMAEYRSQMESIHKIHEKELETVDLTIDDYALICLDHFPNRTPDEIKLRWDNFDNPYVNNNNFSKSEDKELLRLALKYEGRRWFEVARELNDMFSPIPTHPDQKRAPLRTPISCLMRYQRSLNPSLMKREWTKEEDETLKMAFTIHGDKNWQTIAEYLNYRTGQQCLHRWQKTLNPAIKRGKWSPQEDDLLRSAVEVYGYGNWVMVKKHVPGRTDMQCRERWCNVIDPQINKKPFTEAEDIKLKELIAEHGVGKWSLIASGLGTRTDNQCWRRWKQTQCKSEDLVKYQEKVLKRKKVVVGNFVGREKERSTLSVDDIIEVQESLKNSNNNNVV